MRIDLRDCENRKDFAAMDKTDQDSGKEQTVRLL